MLMDRWNYYKQKIRNSIFFTQTPTAPCTCFGIFPTKIPTVEILRFPDRKRTIFVAQLSTQDSLRALSLVERQFHSVWIISEIQPIFVVAYICSRTISVSLLILPPMH